MERSRRRRAAGAAIAAATATAAASLPAGADGRALIAAYDRYQQGSGFQIGLVNLSTGATISLPAGVNTAADELHPTLSPDGRFLAFMRTTLLPKLNGDIVPPASRSVVIVDRTTGTTRTVGDAAGPELRVSSGTLHLAWGVRPFLDAQSRTIASRHATVANGDPGAGASDLGRPPTGGVVDATHAAFSPDGLTELDGQTLTNRPFPTRYVGYAVTDASSGALLNATVGITSERPFSGGFGTEGSSMTFGSADAPAFHPVSRTGDNYVALARAGQIESIAPETETQLTAAPAAINSASAESMPTWSPDGLKLGFVRTTSDRREIRVFDATPGIQSVVLAPFNAGRAPTPQTRAYQDAWGGLSLAEIESTTVPKITCDASCLQSLSTATSGTTILSPTLSSTSLIGIFVVRVKGTRTVLGRRIPRIRPVGRVPLGLARKGRARIRWDGRVAGKRLKPGTYLLTYRALEGDRVTTVSGSIRVRLGKGGKVLGARRQR